MRLATLAPGKVNLCLFVGRPGADGLHPLVSIVQPVSLADELVLEPAPGAPGDEVVCPGVEGPNLADRALALYREASGWDGPPVRLRILKRVPVAAGMGGGSADAAGALRLVAAAAAGALESAGARALETSEPAAPGPADPLLRALAPRLGSDVSALLESRRTLMTGTGERVQALDAGAPLSLVLVPSPHALATADVYREADRLGGGRAPQELARLERALRATGSELPEALAVNDLQTAARTLCPAIDGTLAALRRAGAERALVSGSGPTVFGVFTGADGATRARAAATVLARALVVVPATRDLAAVRALP